MKKRHKKTRFHHTIWFIVSENEAFYVSKTLFWIKKEVERKIAHHNGAERRDVIRLTFRKVHEHRCAKGGTRRAVAHRQYYYTSNPMICKYPIVTKIGINFREKAYGVENNENPMHLFVAFPDRHACRTKKWKNIFSKK